MRRTKNIKLRTTTIIVLYLLCGGALLSVGREAKASADEAPIPVLAWQPCADPDQSGFDCATAKVPLDYRNPRGESINLAVIRRRATDLGNRIGSLFFNPGGPGGAGTEDLPAWINLFAPELRTRFDIISWDPRGIGASTAVQCFDTEEDEKRFFDGVPSNFFPVGDREQREWTQRFARFGRVCRRRNGKLLKHVSTADSARDLDLLRRAVGDAQLNYLGVSYGTILGATYANLFPEKVRAMVLDGNVDPVAWTNGGSERAVLSTSLRLGSDVASAKTLNAFFDLCGQASTDECAFSAGGAVNTREKWKTLLQRARPVIIKGETITYAALATVMNDWLATTEPQSGGSIGWTNAANLLQQMWSSSNPEAPPAPAPAASPSANLAAGRQASTGVIKRYAGSEQGSAVQ